jgi:type IV secretory pathway protease TraF
MRFSAGMRATLSKLWLGGAVAALAALVFVSDRASQDVVLFNHSPSVPVGFYVRDSRDLASGMFVTVRARDVAPVEAAAHRYDDERDRFIKRLAAVAGQHVCSDGRMLNVDGVEVAMVQNRAGAPQGWVGCRTLSTSEILLLGDSTDSFDGRYWGPVSASLVEGVWRPL